VVVVNGVDVVVEVVEDRPITTGDCRSAQIGGGSDTVKSFSAFPLQLFPGGASSTVMGSAESTS
jgi:hypothetical protein